MKLNKLALALLVVLATACSTAPKQCFIPTQVDTVCETFKQPGDAHGYLYCHTRNGVTFRTTLPGDTL